jgi:T-complex protein 1 subunit epsilon
MSLAFDEYGRPFIIIREQEKKKRTKGLEAHKVGIPCYKYSLTRLGSACDSTLSLT